MYVDTHVCKNYKCMCIYTYMYVFLLGTEDQTQRFIHRCYKSSSGPLQEHCILLTAESSLQPPELYL